ncbi:hypothetical protein SEA_BAXTERFOX_70 [Gordonia phage BaxterFox]|uniref:DUF4326 domain-containing protein n=1 Tax=Gordonia phage BaxterFox TaxID=1821549 RepID=A0A142KCP7_9CAUD|nr:hypothetical protein SEA_BAXTERFOX_70 [Gordonia phage BaxterFox]AMS03880.1 hypothetical protein SEA_BAXTERFOX_70 [Gordonia phage BaxterFox]
MTAPQRIQRRRTKGWRMPEGAVYVGRPTRWGNPWRVDVLPPTRGSVHSWNRVHHVSEDRSIGSFVVPETARRVATSQFYSDLVNDRMSFTLEDVRRDLAGRDLCCWCPPTPLTRGGSVDWLDLRCHAEVLLELANGGDR